MEKSIEVVINTLWVLTAGILVFFMQCGFACLETGFTRAKNASNIFMKNLLDFCVGLLAFWLVGFYLKFRLLLRNLSGALVQHLVVHTNSQKL
jgi:Amt family ammonium transporter